MEDILINFNDNSKKVVNDLTKNDRRFAELIKKLQIAKDDVDNKIKLINVLT